MLQNNQICGTMFKNTTKRFNKIVQSPLSLVVFGQGFNIGEHDMGKQIEDLTGQKFNKLTVIKRVENDKRNNSRWLCKCDCGNEKIISGYHLKRASIVSCGCYIREITSKRSKTHEKTNLKLYDVWAAMKTRCYNKNRKEYKNYGGRGITVCDEWKDNFMTFYNWAMANGYDENAPRGECTIDRIDVNGNYEPNNCRFVNMKVQQNNKRNNCLITYNNETRSITEWSKTLNISVNAMRDRLKKYNNCIEKAFTQKKYAKKYERV